MITYSRLKEVLRYNKNTGAFVWRIYRNGLIGAGHPAGSLHKAGYVYIKVDDRLYKAHRLAWLYVTGSMPTKDVEHKNRNKADNRWRNLRLTDDWLNQANVGIKIDNTSGYKNVQWRNDSKKWRVRITVRGKRIPLGHFTNKKLAHAAHAKAAREHFGEFARVR